MMERRQTKARTEYLRDHGMSVADLAEQGAIFPVVRMEVDFKASGNEQVYHAEVYAFESTISSDSRMLTIRAKMKNDQNLFPGTFVTLPCNLGQEKEAMMIPAGSIIPVLKGQKIMVVRNGVVVDVPVELGLRTSDKVQVMGEINPGDQVLTSGLLAVRAGMPVTVKKAQK